MPTQSDLILRLLFAAALAGLLGIERELTEQPAGFRTHILVGVGAALFAIVSAYGFQAIVAADPKNTAPVDPSRVVAQIVVGIGFLGGGAIIKYGASVRGLTTAASLWVTAAVGTAMGVGLLLMGTAATGITLVALVGLRPLRSLVRRYSIGRDEFLLQGDPQLDVEGVVSAVRESGSTLLELQITEESGERTLHLAARVPRGVRPADLATALAAVEHVRNVDWIR